MPRQATRSRLRDDHGSPPDEAESVNETPSEFDEEIETSAAPEALDAAFPGAEELPPLKAPKPKRSRRVLQLILIAIFGLAAGFIAVMML